MITKSLAMLIMVFGLASVSCSRGSPVATAEAACAVATAQVTALRRLPTSHVAYCDQIDGARAGFYIIGLRAQCLEDLCGSTLMGWFAVEKDSGKVFEVNDVGEWTIGQRVSVGS